MEFVRGRLLPNRPYNTYEYVFKGLLGGKPIKFVTKRKNWDGKLIACRLLMGGFYWSSTCGRKVDVYEECDPGYDDYYPDAAAICLAVLRRDSFISLDAGEQTGIILTELLQ